LGQEGWDTALEFDRYRYTDTDTDTYLPISFKPIPIPILGFPFYFLPIPISILKFISYRYRYQLSGMNICFIPIPIPILMFFLIVLTILNDVKPILTLLHFQPIPKPILISNLLFISNRYRLLSHLTDTDTDIGIGIGITDVNRYRSNSIQHSGRDKSAYYSLLGLQNFYLLLLLPYTKYRN
jgi:hypothetical protein